MKVELTERGFERIERASYGRGDGKNVMLTLVQQSSAFKWHDDSINRPGESFLWIGEEHHLDKEEVRDLISHLQSWVDTGSLKPKE